MIKIKVMFELPSEMRYFTAIKKLNGKVEEFAIAIKRQDDFF